MNEDSLFALVQSANSLEYFTSYAERQTNNEKMDMLRTENDGSNVLVYVLKLLRLCF